MALAIRKNKYNQHYNALQVFAVGKEEFVRVKFTATGNIQVVSMAELISGFFTDSSVDITEGREIIAINRQGEKMVVGDIHKFCDNNKLDYNMVIAVLNGNQKTHRKWRFELNGIEA